MKLRLTSIFTAIILYLFILLTPASAQNCGMAVDRDDCTSMAGCSWDGRACLSRNGTFSSSAHDLLNAIGLINPTNDLSTIPGIINAILPTALVIAGLILFIMLLMGGFEYLMAGTDPKSAEKGQQRITTAVIGFLIIFTAYWVTQIVEIVLGISILGG